MKITLKDILFIAILAVMAFFLLDGCEAKRALENETVSLASYKDSVHYYTSRNGELIATNKALVISNEEHVDGLKEELKNLKLKKAKVVVKYETVTQIQDVEIPIDIPCEDFSKEVYIDSTHYRMQLHLTRSQLKIRELSFPNNQTIAVAKKKEKWWKASEYSVVVKNSNPNVISVGLQSYTIEPEKEFYKKRWFWAAVGFLGGAYVGNQLK